MFTWIWVFFTVFLKNKKNIFLELEDQKLQTMQF